MSEEVKAFKKFKGIVLNALPKGYIFGWTKPKGEDLPSDTVYGGFTGSPQPSERIPAKDILRVECEKSGLFHAGTLKFIGMDGTVLSTHEHKDNANLKAAEEMNRYLELYRTACSDNNA